MNLYDTNRVLLEMIAEAEDDTCSITGGTWRTINGTHVCVGKWKKGRTKEGAPILLGPEKLKTGGEDGKWSAEKAQDKVDDIMGDRDHDLEAKENDDGEPELGHPDVEEKVSIGKGTMGLFTSMLAYVDVLQAAAATAAGALSSKLFDAAGDLYDALDDWSQKGQS